MLCAAHGAAEGFLGLLTLFLGPLGFLVTLLAGLLAVVSLLLFAAGRSGTRAAGYASAAQAACEGVVTAALLLPSYGTSSGSPVLQGIRASGYGYLAVALVTAAFATVALLASPPHGG